MKSTIFKGKITAKAEVAMAENTHKWLRIIRELGFFDMEFPPRPSHIPPLKHSHLSQKDLPFELAETLVAKPLEFKEV
jgi:hypothetical protein